MLRTQPLRQPFAEAFVPSRIHVQRIMRQDGLRCGAGGESLGGIEHSNAKTGAKLAHSDAIGCQPPRDRRASAWWRRQQRDLVTLGTPAFDHLRHHRLEVTGRNGCLAPQPSARRCIIGAEGENDEANLWQIAALPATGAVRRCGSADAIALDLNLSRKRLGEHGAEGRTCPFHSAPCDMTVTDDRNPRRLPGAARRDVRACDCLHGRAACSGYAPVGNLGRECHYHAQQHDHGADCSDFHARYANDRGLPVPAGTGCASHKTGSSANGAAMPTEED